MARGDSAPVALSPAPEPKAELEAPEAGATREELLRRDEDHRRELAILRERLKRLEAGPGAQKLPPAGGGRDVETFVDPSKDELLALAAECRIAFDTPPLKLEPFTLGDTQSSELGLTADQRQRLDKRLAVFHARVMSDMRALYVEVTGDQERGEELSPASLGEEITSKSPDEDKQAIFQKLSRERAGLSAPPSDLRGTSPSERYYRMMMKLGDEFERELASVVGAERAHALRKEHGGWGSRSGMSAGCPGN
jgi:hypothetical protein